MRWWDEWKAHVAWGEGLGGTGPGLGCEGLSAAAGEVCGAAVGGAGALNCGRGYGGALTACQLRLRTRVWQLSLRIRIWYYFKI